MNFDSFFFVEKDERQGDPSQRSDKQQKYQKQPKFLKKIVRRKLKEIKIVIKSLKKNNINKQAKTGPALVFAFENELESWLTLQMALGRVIIPHKRYIKGKLAAVRKIISRHVTQLSAIPEAAALLNRHRCTSQIGEAQAFLANYIVRHQLTVPMEENRQEQSQSEETKEEHIHLSSAIAQYERSLLQHESNTMHNLLDRWFKKAEPLAEQTIRTIAQTILSNYGNGFLNFRDPALDGNFAEELSVKTATLMSNAASWLQARQAELLYPGILPPLQQQPDYKPEQAFTRIKQIFQSYFSNVSHRIPEWFSDKRVSLMPGKFKQGGAFTDPVSPEAGPYLFMNFRFRLQDVITLAHECGHLLYYSLRKNLGPLVYASSDLHSEIAAAFTEFLVIDNLDISANQKKQTIERQLFAKVIRQNILFNAELNYYQTLYNRTTAGCKDQQHNAKLQFSSFWAESWKTLSLHDAHSDMANAHWFSYNRHYFNYPLYGITYSAGTLAGLGFYRSVEDKTISKEEYSHFLSQPFTSCSNDTTFIKALNQGIRYTTEIMQSS